MKTSFFFTLNCEQLEQFLNFMLATLMDYIIGNKHVNIFVFKLKATKDN